LIRVLENEVGVDSIERLLKEIEKAETFDLLNTELQRVLRALKDDGDGLSIEQLVEECKDVDLDQIAVHQEILEQEVGEREAERDVARDRFLEAKKAFEAVGYGDRAAVAEGERQTALAEIRNVAQDYVRLRTAEILIKWSIDRNRREKQGPILEAASALFARLTLGSFQALEIDFDNKDNLQLVGRRPSGELVDVNGMSAGTADQLFLALRIAALKDHIAVTQPLPFIADDLFINFDDQRSSAGLESLADLATKCQVLFFTHHEHLVQLAKEALPSAVSVWRMNPHS